LGKRAWQSRLEKRSLIEDRIHLYKGRGGVAWGEELGANAEKIQQTSHPRIQKKEKYRGKKKFGGRKNRPDQVGKNEGPREGWGGGGGGGKVKIRTEESKI